MSPFFHWVTRAGIVAGALSAATAHAELFISEYVEGSSNNKAIEIYNPDNSAVDLSSYQLQMYFNGSSSVGLSIALTGTLAPQSVYVIAQSNAEAGILAVANQVNGSGWFNGDDAVVLSHAGTPVDVIGQIGVDPGTGWGTSATSTANHTLRRKAGISAGDTNPDDAFDPAVEWDIYPQDDISDLGQYNGVSGGGSSGGGQTGSVCGDAATYISQIQGSGDTSPLAGQQASVEAVVTADFQGSDKLGGFFIEEEAADQDADPSTSEGLFVYDGSAGVSLAVGDRVRVTGTVQEYYGMTELGNVTDVQVCAHDQTVPDTELQLPLTSASDLEALEGMRVSLPQTLTVSENYNLGRYGQLLLSEGRLPIPTNIAAPGADAVAVAALNALNRLVLDDGFSVQNPDPVIYPAPGLSAANVVRDGDQVQNLEGVLYYGFNQWSLEPVTTPQFIPTNERTSAPPVQHTGNLTVASFNVLNFFNGDGMGGGFPTARGANTEQEFERQAAKIVSAIRDLNADVVGLMELENDGYSDTSAIADLVQRLNAAGGDEYAYVNPGLSQLGTDAIAVGMIYKPAKVQPLGAAATTSAYPFDDYNRQPLAQTFKLLSSGKTFTVVVNHFKSKGCTGSTGDNTDQGDGQSCWNAKRVEAANALADWLATDPTHSGGGRDLIIGDLNAYAQEDPIAALKDKGYTNLVEQFHGLDAYSYVYNGEAGYLDHALASPDLQPDVVDVTEWHINADEPRVLDYNLEYKSAGQQVSYYDPGPYRASDHDPLLVTLDLPALPGDFNQDGKRNLQDLRLLLGQLFRPVNDNNSAFDLNGDGWIGFADLIAFIKL